MKIFMISTLLFFLSIDIAMSTTAYTTTDVINGKVDWKKTANFELLLVNNTNSVFFCDLSGDTKVMNGTCHLFLTDTVAQLKSATDNNGVWAGIGMGKETMLQLDMVTFHYWASPPAGMPASGWMVGDCSTPATGREVKLDTELANGDKSVDSISNPTFTMNEISIGAFKSQLVWSFSKNVGIVDQYDWQDAKNWQTNKGMFTGAWNRNMKTGMMMKHSASPVLRKLEDGLGFPAITGASSLFISFIQLLTLLYILM